MTGWDAQDRLLNRRALRERFAPALTAMATLDRDGHELLLDAGTGCENGVELTVGLALFRRSVAQFTGIRRLAEEAMPQQATLLARAHFETIVAFRYLVYGGRRCPSFSTPTSLRGRSIRARFYWASDLRHQIYRRYAALDGRIPSRVPIGSKARNAIQDEIDLLDRALGSDFPTQARRFGPIRARGPKRPQYHDDLKWYSFGFRKRRVRTFRELCDAFRWAQAYEMLYEPYSGWQHPRSLWHDCSLGDKYIDVHSPYIVDSFETVVAFSSMMQSFTHMAFAKAYRPEFIPRVQRTSLQGRPSLFALKPGLPPGFA